MGYLRAALLPCVMLLGSTPLIPTPACFAAEAATSQKAPADETLEAITLFNGLEYQGIVQKTSTADTLELLTAYGTLSFHRSDIVKTRQELSDSEKAAIRVAVRDADAHRRLTEERRTAVADRPAHDNPLPRVRAGREPNGSADVAVPHFTESLSWQERMDRQLNKRVTIELVGDNLTDTMALMGNLTGLNIIINPKVQQANPTVNLKVQDMDAATALRWITKLTETYAEIKDHAIYITDKPSKEADDEEKTEIMMMAMRVGADVQLPADGTPLTDEDRMTIAKAIMAKETPKVRDFPGPDLGLDGIKESNTSPFAAPAP
jgi:hypothetical protein